MEHEGELIDALGRLAKAVEKNNELQAQSIEHQEQVISELEGLAQEIADMHAFLKNRSPESEEDISSLKGTDAWLRKDTGDV